MTENLAKNPRKGILKNSSSFETKERQHELSRGAKFDEMNIIATLHPKDKDYGHMKIEEPKTPYNYEVGESGDDLDGVDPQLLADKMMGATSVPKVLEEKSDESSEDENLTEEEKKRKKSFESKRKHHYNEFQAVKLARKLMEEEAEDEDEDETAEAPKAEGESANVSNLQ